MLSFGSEAPAFMPGESSHSLFLKTQLTDLRLQPTLVRLTQAYTGAVNEHAQCREDRSIYEGSLHQPCQHSR